MIVSLLSAFPAFAWIACSNSSSSSSVESHAGGLSIWPWPFSWFLSWYPSCIASPIPSPGIDLPGRLGVIPELWTGIDSGAFVVAGFEVDTADQCEMRAAARRNRRPVLLARPTRGQLAPSERMAVRTEAIRERAPHHSARDKEPCGMGHGPAGR
jgi:hypothetical protein